MAHQGRPSNPQLAALEGLDKMRLVPDFPPRLRDLVVHMILSHHGQMDFGSPKIPLFPEALLLHLLDNMDSKMECMRALIENDRQVDGCFTTYHNALGRTALKKDRYLNPHLNLQAPEEAKPAAAAQQEPPGEHPLFAAAPVPLSPAN
jgi:3'-5' exoribonuclease